MKTEIIQQRKNPFLKREEYLIKITNESAPSTSDVIKELGKDESLTVVKKINTNFGKQEFLIEAVVYEDAKLREEIETIPQKIRKKMEAERKAEEERLKKEAEAAKKAEEEAKAAAETEPKEEEKTE